MTNTSIKIAPLFIVPLFIAPLSKADYDAWQDEMLVGITHVILHPNTWNTTECCYLEDLYVSEVVRGRGVGRALIEQVYEFANEKNCNRVYWTTQEDNATARKLYDVIATQTDMVQYRKDL